jgi:hypothetical protein
MRDDVVAQQIQELYAAVARMQSYIGPSAPAGIQDRARMVMHGAFVRARMALEQYGIPGHAYPLEHPDGSIYMVRIDPEIRR